MTETGRHERCVDAWLATRFFDDEPAAEQAALLRVALCALWERARPSLGEVTLAAIFQRAIHTAERRHPVLETLGLRVTDRWTIALETSAPLEPLRDAVACVLVEVLRAVSHATANGLAAPLRTALASAAGDEHRALVLLRPACARPDGREERGTP